MGYTVSQKKIGSPPRVRGKAVWKDIKRAEKRITPACAGKSREQQETDS